jgi:hypothetical protein
VVARGEEGSGFVARGPEDNIFAGKDGNIYRKTDEGWQQLERGDKWTEVKPSESEKISRENIQDRSSERENIQDRSRPETDKRPKSSQPKPDTMKREGKKGTIDQLDRDARNRTEGSRRNDQYKSWKKSSGSKPSRGSYGSRGSMGRRGGGRRGRR